MTNESLPNREWQNVWQNQPTEGIRMSVDEIRRRAGKFERKIYWRNAREYAAALAVVIFFGFELSRGPDLLTGAGFALMIAGMLYLVAQLYRRTSPRSLPAEMRAASGVDFYRRELERQRDALRSVWRWYLGPLVPGVVVTMVAMARNNPHHIQHDRWFLAAYGVLVALAFAYGGRLNTKAARRLQRQIDQLDALKS